VVQSDITGLSDPPSFLVVYLSFIVCRHFLHNVMDVAFSILLMAPVAFLKFETFSK